MIRNPKQADTDFFDCIPQKGECPIGCNQCFFNRPGAYYVPLDQLPLVPTPEEVGNGTVRMNCGGDSNIQRELVIATAAQYRRRFFNTSIPNLDFPGPVVLTANPKEEQCACLIHSPPANLMFVRLRVSGTNLQQIDIAVDHYTRRNVPVVLTFMAYYSRNPVVDRTDVPIPAEECYVWKVRHINSYYCATAKFMSYVRDRYHDNRLVSMCSSLNDSYCRSCRNCETYYIQTEKRMRDE